MPAISRKSLPCLDRLGCARPLSSNYNLRAFPAGRGAIGARMRNVQPFSRRFGSEAKTAPSVRATRRASGRRDDGHQGAVVHVEDPVREIAEAVFDVLDELTAYPPMP